MWNLYFVSFFHFLGISTSLLLYPSHLMVCFLLVLHVLIPFFPLLISPRLVPHLFMVSIMPAEEVQKLQKHLALLRQEYVKMQQKLVETERRCSVLAAQASLPGSASQASDSFISRLLAIVADLFQQEQYRWEVDMNMQSHTVRWDVRWILTKKCSGHIYISASTRV